MSGFNPWRCALGMHDWITLDVEACGSWRWNTWEVRRECQRCGRFDSYHETNRRRVESLKANEQAVTQDDEAAQA